MLMWNKLDNQADIDDLMQVYGSFHDSCIKQVFIRTREFVDEQQSMSFDNSPMVRLLFQRQFAYNQAIEIQFDNVVEFNWLHDNLNASVESALILQAVLQKQNGLLYWADDSGWLSADQDKNEFRWISAETAKWRVVENGLGEADISVNL